VIQFALKLPPGNEIPINADAVPRIGEYLQHEGIGYKVTAVKWATANMPKSHERIAVATVVVRQLDA
jgi:hypothetical protein